MNGSLLFAVALFAAPSGDAPTLVIPAPSLRTFDTATFSGDEKRLIVVVENRIQVWDLASQSLIVSRSFDAREISARYDPDSGLIGVPIGNRVEILNQDTLATVRVFELPNRVIGVSFSGGATYTFNFGTGWTPWWAPREGGEPAPLSPERATQMRADASREEKARDARLHAAGAAPGRWVSCEDFKDGYTAELSDESTPKRKVFKLRPGSINCRSMSLSPSGRLAVELTENGGVILYDLDARAVLRRFENPVREQMAAISPDGKILVTSPEIMKADGWSLAYLEVWDLALLHRRFRIPFSYGSQRVLFRRTRPDGPYDEAYVGHALRLHRVRLSDGKVLASIEKVEDRMHTALRMAPDGRSLYVDRVADESSRRLNPETLQPLNPEPAEASVARPIFTTTGALVPVHPGWDDPNTTYDSTRDGSLVVYCTYNSARVRIWDSRRQAFISEWALPSEAGSVAVTKDDRAIIVGIREAVVAYTFEGRELWRNRSITSNGRRVLMTDSGWVLVNGTDLLDATSGKTIAHIHRVDDDLLVSLPTGTYAASKQAFSAITFAWQGKHYPFSEFDLTLNRPDEVAQALGASPRDVENLRAAVTARQRRQSSVDLGFERLPVTLRPDRLPWRTKDATVTLELSSPAVLSSSRARVWVNDVPLGDRAGALWPSGATGAPEPSMRVTVPLSFGPNRIEVGIEEGKKRSARQVLYIDRAGVAPKHTTYVLSVGTSKYKDADYSLQFAAKDASDIASYFSGARGKSVRSVVLKDEQVTADGLRRAAEFLRASELDDEVIVFFAGHGLLGPDGRYYYATHDTTFTDPTTGFSVDAIEALFDGVKARRRVVFLDTCFSGDESYTSATGEPNERGVREVKTRGLKLKGQGAAAVVAPFAFADLRRGIGAAMVASAGGSEFAMESESWANGVFTYALLEALKTKRGDRNQDGHLTISEVKEMVGQRVRELTGGKQRPTTRQENFAVDFEL